MASELTGQLIKPRPLADAVAGNFDLLSNPYFIGDQPGGTQISGWLGAWSPEQSHYVVIAMSAGDVAAAVSFAERHGIRLVVKGGGHSLLGTSNAPDSLLIWTRKLSDIEVHDAFVPTGAPATARPLKAVTFGAGCMLMEAYAAVTTEHGRFVQGGECTTVGFAGLVANGGFGNFSKNFGMAAAHLVEAEIVTAEGQIRIVNAYCDPDLLWALKGGGGGSFGVMTRLTLRTHDLPDQFGVAGGVVEARSRVAMIRLIEQFFQFYEENLHNPHWGGGLHLKGNRLEVTMYCQDLDELELQWTWLVFAAWVSEHGQDYTVTSDIGAACRPARSWWDFAAHKESGMKGIAIDDRPEAPGTGGWWEADQEQVGAFVYGCDSVWLGEQLLADRRRLAEHLHEAAEIFQVDLHFGMGLAGASPSAKAASRDTATNPVMLDAFALAIVGMSGKPRYPGLEQERHPGNEGPEEAAKIHQSMAVLRRLAPEGGSYISQSNYFSATWRADYWGANAERLSQVKAKYDPQNRFEVHHGIA